MDGGDVKRHCEDCGGNVHLSTLLPGRWMHDEEAIWSVRAHPVRLREEEPEPEVVPTPMPEQGVETAPHNERSPVETGQQLLQIADFLNQTAGGGRLVLSFDSDGREWTLGCEFGRESEDSDMVGGAAYSRGADVELCISDIAHQLGLSA